MQQPFMQKPQRTGDSVWSLPARTSMTLKVGPGCRVIQVGEGRLWLTSSATPDEASMDVWLVPGDSLELPAGLAVVIEAWPSARFRLLVPPNACRAAEREVSMLSRAAAWTALALQRRRAAPVHHGFAGTTARSS